MEKTIYSKEYGVIVDKLKKARRGKRSLTRKAPPNASKELNPTSPRWRMANVDLISSNSKKLPKPIRKTSVTS